MKTPDVFLEHPLIAAAILARNLHLHRLPWNNDKMHGRVVDLPMRENSPALWLAEHGAANIMWPHAMHQIYIKFLDGDTIVTIYNHESPDTLLSAATGKILSEIFDFPGASGMRINKAENSTDTTAWSPTGLPPTDTLIQVEIARHVPNVANPDGQ